MICSRGYSVATYATLQSAYYSDPTPLQEASLGAYSIGLVNNRDFDGLRKALASGLSSNASNGQGESLLHMVCQSGDSCLLAVLLEAGCDTQVADSYGRTPLHAVCWATQPSFKIVEMLAEKDIRLFHMTDCHGAGPLSYVREEHWAQWHDFLESKKDVIWPFLDNAQEAPPLTLQLPNTRSVVEPDNALTVELARMVANGRMTPAEASMLNYDVAHEDCSDYEDGTELSEEGAELPEISQSLDDGSWNDDEIVKDIFETLALPKRNSIQSPLSPQ